ncbi:aminomethyltransferase, mitochondrial [Anoplophora glabripennis]|uniref:aminomethyltransferase, mitochondrial n=1 Tax=Anoplophora glabripennis TaxID=217634 RepID=UPI0008757196|nr:aminomethyltransferase, mitochondrial [Anoplophora glabripennis]
MFSLRAVSKPSVGALKRAFSSDVKAEATALFDFHVERGGKIVNFGGFLLPVQYSDLSIVNSHLFTRKSASLFDVSHMLQTEIYGKDCVAYLESVCTADIQGLQDNGAVLTVFTNQQGGILDDLIITKIAEDHLYVVSNAARKHHDQQHLLKALDSHRKRNPSTDIKLRYYEPLERGLLALQGPRAAEALQNLTDVDLSQLYFMNSTTGNVAGVENCRITRCGYTGEDGFEIEVPASSAVKLAAELLTNENVKLAGLGARDSLRLEAGLCLYGNDITSETTPVEAALTWLVAKRRRELKDFPGAEAILRQIREGSSIKRVGLVSKTGPPARQGASIICVEDQEVGKVTSGCPSPSLGGNIAMGYVPTSYSKVGTRVGLKIRDRVYDAVVSKMPFVKANYYNRPK